MIREEAEGIVVANREYREKDALLTILSADRGKLSLVAKGVQKIDSRSAGYLQLYTKAQFAYSPRGSLHALIQVTPLAYYRRIRGDLLRQAFAALFCEMAVNSEDHPALYGLLDAVLTELETQPECYTAACVFVNELCRLQGIAPMVDACAGCGTKMHIQTLSLRQGGFLCTSCMDALRDERWSKSRLRRFRLLCHADMTQIAKLKEHLQCTWADFTCLYAFFREYSGVRIHSYAFLEQVVQMEQ